MGEINILHAYPEFLVINKPWSLLSVPEISPEEKIKNLFDSSPSEDVELISC